MNIFTLAIAGAFGTICRYEIGKLISLQNYPIATLFVNTLGSLFLGFLFFKYATNNQQLYVILGIGFCGGFTTFSTFSLDLFKMIQNENYLQFISYLFLSIILGVVAVMLGYFLAKNIS